METHFTLFNTSSWSSSPINESPLKKKRENEKEKYGHSPQVLFFEVNLSELGFSFFLLTKKKGFSFFHKVYDHHFKVIIIQSFTLINPILHLHGTVP